MSALKCNTRHWFGKAWPNSGPDRLGRPFHHPQHTQIGGDGKPAGKREGPAQPGLDEEPAQLAPIHASNQRGSTSGCIGLSAQAGALGAQLADGPPQVQPG